MAQPLGKESKVVTQAMEVMAAFLLKAGLGQFYGGYLGLGRLWLANYREGIQLRMNFHIFGQLVSMASPLCSILVSYLLNKMISEGRKHLCVPWCPACA